MKALAPLIDLARLTYLKWARAEIDPMHPDLPGIVLAINALESKPCR